MSGYRKNLTHLQLVLLLNGSRDAGGLGYSWFFCFLRRGRNTAFGGPRSLAVVADRKLTPSHGADGAGALLGIGQQWSSGRGNDDRWRPGGFEVRGSGFGVWASEFCLLGAAVPRSRCRP
jgi:hypothetical protein